MPWLGVILWRWNERPHGTACSHWRREYCVQFDRKRNMYELPKGGAKRIKPRRIPMQTEKGVQIVWACDSSPFATARWELFEETGIWVGWRERGSYAWISRRGEVWPGVPCASQSAWLCTELRGDDTYCPDRTPMWMNLEEFGRLSRRDDHYRLLKALHGVPCHQSMPCRPLAGASTSARRT